MEQNTHKNFPSKERQLAVDILYAAFGGRKLDRSFEDTVAVFEKDTKTRINQVYNLVYGVARRHHALNAYIDTKVKKEKLPIKAGLILEIGLYELAFNTSSKSYAVISDALKLADFLQLPKFKPVINAVLRRFADDLDAGVKSILSQKQLPAYIFDEIKNTFGDDATKVMQNLLEPSPMFLTVNTLLTDTKKLILSLAEQGIVAVDGKFETKSSAGAGAAGSPGVAGSFDYIKTTDSKIFKTPEFEKGMFMVQDLSSQIAVTLLKPFEGMNMLDVCTAPGGKAIYSAILAKDNAKIKAVDISSSRLFRVHENIKRMNVKSIEVLAADFMEHNFGEERFDRIFLDPPCSALGVISRNPDVTWKKSGQAIKDLAVIQTGMLSKAMGLLKPGGRLVYSVCTFTQLETTDVIKKIAKASETILTIPNDVGMDGLFVAVLEK
jgi:16S rRNA (cytosine967-C5)-methyltransferase